MLSIPPEPRWPGEATANPDFANAREAIMNEILMEVTGMTCGSCVRHVTGALKAVDGVEDVAVDLASGRVAVRGRPGTAPNRLTSALTDAGYPARIVEGAAASSAAPARRSGGCCCS